MLAMAPQGLRASVVRLPPPVHDQVNSKREMRDHLGLPSELFLRVDRQGSLVISDIDLVRVRELEKHLKLITLVTEDMKRGSLHV